MAGIAGLEPAKCKSQSLVPYRLGYIPIFFSQYFITHKKQCQYKNPPRRDFYVSYFQLGYFGENLIIGSVKRNRRYGNIAV